MLLALAERLRPWRSGSDVQEVRDNNNIAIALCLSTEGTAEGCVILAPVLTRAAAADPAACDGVADALIAHHDAKVVRFDAATPRLLLDGLKRHGDLLDLDEGALLVKRRRKPVVIPGRLGQTVYVAVEFYDRTVTRARADRGGVVVRRPAQLERLQDGGQRVKLDSPMLCVADGGDDLYLRVSVGDRKPVKFGWRPIELFSDMEKTLDGSVRVPLAPLGYGNDAMLYRLTGFRLSG